MNKVIVTVMREGDPVGLDLELPVDVEAATLARWIAAGIEQNPGTADRAWQLEALPAGRVLLPHETLAAAQVWDGAWLILK